MFAVRGVSVHRLCTVNQHSLGKISTLRGSVNLTLDNGVPEVNSSSNRS